MTIISTPGDPNANSYVSVDDANLYFTGVLNNTAWPSNDSYVDNEATILRKEAALRESTRVLDSMFRWSGSIASDTQALRWPRSGATNQDLKPIPIDSVPKQIKNATCDLAIYLLQNGGLNVSDSNLTKMKVGPIGMDFSDDVGVTVGIPEYIVKTLIGFGIYTGPISGAITNVNALRS